MSGTLLSICQDAMKEVGNYDAPSTIYGNANPTAVQLLALLTRSGKTLRREKWQALIKTGTITTVASTQTYALPSDWVGFDPMTFWDATQKWSLEGPVSPAEWAALTYATTSPVGIKTYFMVAAGYIYLLPTPSSVRTLNYTYRTKYWIASQTKEAFTDDTDIPDLDDQMLIADLKWRWAQAKGLDGWEVLKADAEDIKSRLLTADGGKAPVVFGYMRSFSPGNLPEIGYGT